MSLDEGGLYYRAGRDESEQGPIPLHELEDLVHQGSLSRHTEVRREGTSVWIRIGRFLNIPESKLPEQASPSMPELANLLDQLLEISDSKPAPSKAERWYCRVYGKELGPVEVPLLRMMVEQGQLSQTDRVRREGEAKWVLADSIGGLFDGIVAAPTKEWKSQPGVGISPQRFSKFVPKPAAPKAPAKPPEPQSVPKQAAAVATAARPNDLTAASPAAAASPPAARTVTPEPRPAAPSYSNPTLPAAGRSTMSASAFAGSPSVAARMPPFTPPAKKSPSRGRSFSLPDFSSFEHGPLVLAIIVVIGVCWLGYSFGFFTAVFEFVKDTFRSVSGEPRDWTDPGW
ncbi:MAG: GYF domain-containing protein [Planctomycetaceae bacterium]